MDERPDAGDDEDHQRRELVEPERERHLQGAGRQPGEDGLFNRLSAVTEEWPGGDDRHDERPDHRQAGDATGDGLRQSPAEECVDDEAHEGQERNQEQHVTT